MVRLEMTRDAAEALYDAAIERMARCKTYGHLYEAAMTIRLGCGMNKGENAGLEAALQIDKDILREQGKPCQTGERARWKKH